MKHQVPELLINEKGISSVIMHSSGTVPQEGLMVQKTGMGNSVSLSWIKCEGHDGLA